MRSFLEILRFRCCFQPMICDGLQLVNGVSPVAAVGVVDNRSNQLMASGKVQVGSGYHNFDEYFLSAIEAAVNFWAFVAFVDFFEHLCG